MKYWFTIISILSVVSLSAQTPNSGDCAGAMRLCSAGSYTFSGNRGDGDVEDLFTSNTCFIDGESNSRWFKFTVDQHGSLVFTIEPVSASDDYDYILYWAGPNGCSGLNVPAGQLRCNFAGTPGITTGIQYGASNTTANVSGDAMLKEVTVISGGTYYLLIDNYTVAGDGFILDFSGSTATFKDDTNKVMITSLVYDPAHQSIDVTLSSAVAVSSVTSSLFNEFSISGMGNVVVDYVVFHDIYSIDGLNVSSNLSIILEQQLTTDVSYLLELDTGGDGNVLLTPCGTETEYDSISFYVAATDTALVGIETAQPVFSDQVQIFPNPTNDVLHISTDLPEGTAWNATLFDLSGKRILTKQVSGQSHRLDVSELPNGTYLLMCSSALGTYQQKVVVLH